MDLKGYFERKEQEKKAQKGGGSSSGLPMRHTESHNLPGGGKLSPEEAKAASAQGAPDLPGGGKPSAQEAVLAASPPGTLPVSPSTFAGLALSRLQSATKAAFMEAYHAGDESPDFEQMMVNIGYRRCRKQLILARLTTLRWPPPCDANMALLRSVNSQRRPTSGMSILISSFQGAIRRKVSSYYERE